MLRSSLQTSSHPYLLCVIDTCSITLYRCGDTMARRLRN